jgi:hypothetical protein
MLGVNDETAKNHIEFVEPSTTLIKPNFFVIVLMIAVITLIRPRSVVF